MRKYLFHTLFALFCISLMALSSESNAADPAKSIMKDAVKKVGTDKKISTKKTNEANTQKIITEKKTLDKEIKDLSTKDVFNKFKKSIKPVDLTSAKDTKSVVIDYPIHSKPLPTGLAKQKLGFKATDKTDSDTFNELLRKAYSASLLGMQEAALHYYSKALERDTNNTNTLFALATIYHKLKQYPDAKLYYQKLLKIAPDYQNATTNYLALIAQSDPNTALDEYLIIEQQNPNHPGILAQIGMIYLNLKQFEKAEFYLKRSIILAPSILQYRYNLAITYDKARNYQMAVELYKDILNARNFNKLGIAKPSLQSRVHYLKKVLFQQSNVKPR